MHVRIAASLIASLLVVTALAAPSASQLPASQPTTSPTTQLGALDAPTLARGRAIRAVLLDTLEAAYAADGHWPDQLVRDVPDTRVRYTPPPAAPASQPTDEAAAFRAEWVAASRVVVEESFAEHPDGIWIGFASGRLEFAEDEAARQRCLAMLDIVRGAPPSQSRLKDPLPAPGTVRLHVVDPQGEPVAGAQVGVWGHFGNDPRVPPGLRMLDDGATRPTTDADGRVTVPGSAIFSAKFTIATNAPLYILDAPRGLIARLDLTRDDLRADAADAAPREVVLQPGCHVIGRSTIVGAAAPLAPDVWQNTLVFDPLNATWYSLQSMNRGPVFECLLPPGDWALNTYGQGSATEYVHIAPGERELRLRPDLATSVQDELIGKPAPELRQIKGWKNGGPTTLAQLRGQVVLLDFWGYWCGPCVGAMPALMKLHDDYHDKGLTIVAVHNDSADSIADMDAKLAKTRAELWGGRDLPFLVALDGGGATRIHYSMAMADGATTAAYGITGYPTTLLVGRDGKVVASLEPDSAAGRAMIEAALAAPATQPTTRLH